MREWDYGDYEGLTSKQIKAQREKDGEKPWNIWTDGCPGGEYVKDINSKSISCCVAEREANAKFAHRSPEDVVKRLDAVIADIKEKYHRPCLEGSGSEKSDVLVVAHGHILRAFAMRWVGKPLTDTSLILDAGGVGTLR